MSQENQLQGVKELAEKLKKLGASVGGKALRSAAGTAMNPVVKAARENAPVGKVAHRTHKGRLVAPGFLSRNVKKRTWKSKDGRIVRASVGVSSEAFYGVQFLEPGTKHIKKNNWLTRAFETNQNKVQANFKKALSRRISKIYSK